MKVLAAAERGGNNFKRFKDFRIEDGPSQDKNLAFSFFCVPIRLTAVGVGVQQ